jgi:hypothetical protein
VEDGYHGTTPPADPDVYLVNDSSSVAPTGGSESSATISITFIFGTPINAFGFFVTDLERGGDIDLRLTPSGGGGPVDLLYGAQTVTTSIGTDPTQVGGPGGKKFFGFIDDMAGYSAVEIIVNQTLASNGEKPIGTPDIGGFDDFTVGSSVPEPSTLTIVGVGTLCMLAAGWRRSRRASKRPGV